MDVKETIKNELDSILEKTTKLSFPLFSKASVKETIIENKRSEIEESIKEILRKHEYEIDLDDIKKHVWEEAHNQAIKEFDNLSEKQKINSFYFQEVMHVYVEKLSNIILESN